MNINKNSLVALDTQILIWGGLRSSVSGVKLQNPADAEKQRLSRILIHELDDFGAKIVIPAVALAELLCGIDPKDHGNFLAEISRRFQCPSFDIRATGLAARLWQLNRSLPKAEQAARTVLKADVQIIASAKIWGVEHFFSDDAKCRKLAVAAGIEAHAIPTHALNLFTELVIKEKDESEAKHKEADSAAKGDSASG